MTLLEINRRLRQRPPFQMVERVTEFIPGKHAVGIKCVSVNEPYLSGHMPELPIMPGVLLIECAAQLCALLFSEQQLDPSRVAVLLKVNEFKFLKPVIPGDRLEIVADCTRACGALHECDVQILCDGDVRAKGSLSFSDMLRSVVYGE